MAGYALSKETPVFAFWTGNITGAQNVPVPPGFNLIGDVLVDMDSVTAATVNNGVNLTSTISADRKSVNVAIWKATSTSNPTLIAATSAVPVRITFFVQ